MAARPSKTAAPKLPPSLPRWAGLSTHLRCSHFASFSSVGELSFAFADGKVTFRWKDLRWVHRYRHGEFRRSFSLKDSARGWHIRVIASDGGTDMTLGGEQVVGWVETHPPHLGQKGLDPGMRSVGPGPIRVLLAMVQIATHISAGYAHMPHQRNHRVGKILADTLPGFECLVDGGVYVRAAWYIVKPVIERGVQLSQ